MIDFIVIIPSRLDSTRLPGKALADLAGKPMVVRVLEQARRSRASRVIVATDHASIEAAVLAAGGEVLLTSPDHPSGTDRLAECVNALKMDEDDIVVNVQGDEPLIPPQVIDQVARNLATRPLAGMATLCDEIWSIEDLLNPNVVKVSRSESGMALTFSRAPLPWDRSRFQVQFGEREAASIEISVAPGRVSQPLGYRHIGLYAYRAGMLRDFSTWGACDIEQRESLEQLRALHHDIRIHVDQAEVLPPQGVDTPEDLRRVRELLEDG